MNLHLLRHVITDNNVNKITQPIDPTIKCKPDELLQFVLSSDTLIEQLGKSVLLLVSPTIRTQETAESLFHEIGDSGRFVAYSMLDNLVEVDFGDFGGKPEDERIDGLTMFDYRSKIIDFYSGGNDTLSFPNGESLREISRRVNDVIGFIKTIKMSNLYSDVVIVGHNRFFRHFLVQTKNWKLSEMFNKKLPHGEFYNVTI